MASPVGWLGAQTLNHYFPHHCCSFPAWAMHVRVFKFSCVPVVWWINPDYLNCPLFNWLDLKWNSVEEPHFHIILNHAHIVPIHLHHTLALKHKKCMINRISFHFPVNQKCLLICQSNEQGYWFNPWLLQFPRWFFF